jgi:hypothetical protein
MCGRYYPQPQDWNVVLQCQAECFRQGRFHVVKERILFPTFRGNLEKITWKEVTKDDVHYSISASSTPIFETFLNMGLSICEKCELEVAQLRYESTCLLATMVLSCKDQLKALGGILQGEEVLRKCTFCRKESVQFLQPKMALRRITDKGPKNDSKNMILLCPTCIQGLESGPKEYHLRRMDGNIQQLNRSDMIQIEDVSKFSDPEIKGKEGEIVGLTRLNCCHPIRNVKNDPTNLLQFYGLDWALETQFQSPLGKLLSQMVELLPNWPKDSA